MIEGKILKKQHGIAHLETYEVSEQELNAIERGYSSRQNDLTFFSIAVSVFLSFLTVWLTLPPPADGATVNPMTRAEQYYILAIIASGAMSVYLFCRWKFSASADDNLFRAIRARAIGPVGEEGKEIKPSELANMTPQPATGGEGEAK